MNKMFLVAAVALSFVLAGCPKPEASARDSIAAAKGFLDQEKVSHPECATTPTTPVCSALKKATGAKDLAIDALEAYCSGPQFDTGGACNAPTKGSSAETQALAKLQTAVSNLDQTINDVKAITGGKQ